MLLNLIILLLLASGLFAGFRRGLILQVVRLAGFVLSWIVAAMYFKQLAPFLKSWIPFPESMMHRSIFQTMNSQNLQSVYYQAIAFLILFLVVKIILSFVSSMLNVLAELPVLHSVNHLSGAVLGFVETYLIVLLLLQAGALVPVAGLQTAISHSSLAQSMIGHTPVLSKMFHNLWLAWIGMF